MLKTLKLTVVMLLCLAATSLVLGIMLFNRRQILLGRTAALEKALTSVSATLETRFSQDLGNMQSRERDISEITAEALASPRTATFWSSYAQVLEAPGTKTLDLNTRRRELQAFFKIDPITLKPARDPITNQRIYDGPGTMQNVLDDVLSTAESQLNRLHETRHQLGRLRTECETATAELNSRKQELRSALCTIVSRDDQIASLRQDVLHRDETIGEHVGHIVDLEGQLADEQHIVAIQVEDIERLSNNVVFWQRRYQVLAGRPKPAAGAWTAMSPGQKGTVASVDAPHNFITMQLNETFVDEYKRSTQMDSPLPAPTLMVTRMRDGKERFVAKVRVGTVDTLRGLGVGTILASWQQDDIHENDTVLY
jgi:hypothetical protein